MEINQKVFKIENKFYSTPNTTGLLLMVNEVLSDIDFSDMFVVEPTKYPDSNEIKGHCVLEKFFNISAGNFTFIKDNVHFKVELVEINEDKLIHSKIIRMRNPLVIMDEEEITEEKFNTYIDRITEVYFASERQKAAEEKANEKPKKIKLYENPVYEKDKRVYIKKGFKEYKNGNFRFLHNPSEEENNAMLVLLDKLSFEVLDIVPTEEGYTFDVTDHEGLLVDKGIAKIENETLVISRIQ